MYEQIFCKFIKIVYLCPRVSLTRPAPSEFPQDLTVARVGGRSGAM